MLAFVVLAIALAGTISSTAFLILVLLGARKFQREVARLRVQAACRDAALPAVSVLKPLHGMEAQLEENLESFYRQDYLDYEILFAARHEDDPGLAVAQQVAAKYPQIRTRILAVGEPPWPNPPVWSYYRMAGVAKSRILVSADSDVRVNRNYLREVVAPLCGDEVGLVTCVYRGLNAGGFWSGLDALGMSVEMTAGVLVANLLEGMHFALGPTIAVRRECLERIGGYEAFGEYLAEDFLIGNLIAKLGYRVVLSQHVIDHVVPPMDARKMWRHLVRWARSTRYSRPGGHLGTGLIFAMPFGILGLGAGLVAGHPWAGLGLFLAAIINRVVEAWAVGWGVVRDPVAKRSPLLYPLRDLLGFAVWVASYLPGNAVWRERKFSLVADGKIVLQQNPQASAQEVAPSN